MKHTRMAVLALFIAFGVSSCLNKETTKTSSSMTTPHDPIILINPFEVPAGSIEASITYWEACRDFLKKEPGYISTQLHRSLKDGATFELINVAVWESADAFTAASRKMAQELGMAPPEGLKANPALYTVISE